MILHPLHPFGSELILLNQLNKSLYLKINTWRKGYLKDIHYRLKKRKKSLCSPCNFEEKKNQT